MVDAGTSSWRGRTLWARSHTAPLRAFMRTEAGSSGVLVAATVAALVWANVDTAGYGKVWSTSFTIQLGRWGITHDVLTWINSGLMTLFFLTVGLEARREFDLGDLRERRRLVLPVLAGLVGMILPVLIYLAINAGGDASHGWGVAMSTDTALALGLLTLLGRGVPDRVRVFLLTVFIVDDLLALLVIALVYSGHISVGRCWWRSSRSSWCSRCGPPRCRSATPSRCSPSSCGWRCSPAGSTRSSPACCSA